MSVPSLERINVNFPRPVLEDLRRLVPAKRRSEVIARATARELRRLKVVAVFAALENAPLWSAAAYPDLLDGPRIDLAVIRLRTGGPFATLALEVPSAPRRKARRE